MIDEDRFRTLEKRLTVIETHIAVDAVHRSNVEKRLNDINDGQKWVFRTLVGAFLLVAATFVLKGGLIG